MPKATQTSGGKYVKSARTRPQNSPPATPGKTWPKRVACCVLRDDALNPNHAVIHTGEVTQAVRDVEFDGLDVSVGDVIGLHDGALVVKGTEIDATALALLERMNVAESEFITIYYGGSINAESGQSFADQVQQLYPDQDVELIFGGQPYYHYILSTE